ncbi:MAG: DNA mismatch repair protein MutS [Mogibacterium sp.]|nr:DNA mismatch repair protein MutS [Mogibacterium sp.]
MAEAKLSPMMQQYMAIKDDYKDAILMYRLGDFYEMFFDDAILASRELELTLTGRNCGLEERAPMCGVPFHSVNQYIVRLVNNGHKVAICEQVEDPAEAKGIVKREITRIYTPGTLDISDAGRNENNVFIASACISDELTAIALADISTGELSAYEYETEKEGKKLSFERLLNDISILDVKELVISDKIASEVEKSLSEHMLNVYLDRIDDSYYRYQTARDVVMDQFGVSSLIPLDLEGREEMASAAGALLMYLRDTQKGDLDQFRDISIKQHDGVMHLDRSTLRNLELLETIYDGDIKGSLLGVIGKTRTAMGGRLLRSWLREPLTDVGEIRKRLDAVEELRNDPVRANNISNSLRYIYDFQRLTARVATGRADARDLIALKKTLAQIPDIKYELSDASSYLLRDLNGSIEDFDELYRLIDHSICEEPPMGITEGGIIKAGYSKDLDRLKQSISGAKEWIANLENTEKERTGIKTLRVGYNKVFGYYIDVSKGMIDKVPEDYIRKQTLVNNERYITPELKEKEDLVLTAEARINKIEYEEFRRIRSAIEPYITRLQNASAAVAALDVIISFAKTALSNGYVKPDVNDGYVIDIKNGRHPAVEQLLGAGMFVSNDTFIDMNEHSMLIITGPNMSGKSTYMRQTAIIVLMAQIGCFVPADSAVIGVTDRIFTRIGASDNLAYGQSTFYIEMSELAGILRNATSRSLIILDEIGRGTSTFDGLSIAWATASYLADPSHRVRTMFATHYHELTGLEDEKEGIHNLSVAAAEDGNDVVFLHNIIEGPASKSYGIHVARIAGIPEVIRKDARHKLDELETFSAEVRGNSIDRSEQISFMSDELAEEGISADAARYRHIKSKISEININTMTPVSALVKLQEIIEEFNDR